jgi:hypothetical protein
MTNRQADTVALRDLVTTYARTVDTRDGAGFARLFAAQAVIEGTGVRIAGEGLAGVPDALRVYTKTFHAIYNTLARVEGDRATGVVYCAAHHLSPLSDGKYDDLVMYLIYNDDYVRSGDTWLFQRRQVDIEFTENRTVENLATLPKMKLKFS